MRKILIVADRLLGGAELRERLALKKSTDPDIEVFVLVRSAPPRPATAMRSQQSRSWSSSWPCCVISSTRSTERSATRTHWQQSARCSSLGRSTRSSSPRCRRVPRVGAHGPGPPHATADEAAGGGGRRRGARRGGGGAPCAAPLPGSAGGSWCRGGGSRPSRRGRRRRRRAHAPCSRSLHRRRASSTPSATELKQSNGCALQGDRRGRHRARRPEDARPRRVRAARTAARRTRSRATRHRRAHDVEPVSRIASGRTRSAPTRTSRRRRRSRSTAICWRRCCPTSLTADRVVRLRESVSSGAGRRRRAA